MKTIVVVERRIQTNWGVWIRLKDSDPNDPFAVPEARRPWRDATGRKRYRLKTRYGIPMWRRFPSESRDMTRLDALLVDVVAEMWAQYNRGRETVDRSDDSWGSVFGALLYAAAALVATALS